MAKKATKKGGKALGRKDMKKTKGGVVIQGGTFPSTQLGGGTLITGNLNGDGRNALNGGSFTGGV